MAKRSDLGGEVVQILDETQAAKKRRELHEARRAEALSLVLAGMTYEQIAERLSISVSGAQAMVNRTLSQAVNRNAEQKRAVENARLDRAQAAIWSKVLGGDIKAVDSFLKISQRRARMNGLDEPTKINLSVNVRAEMEQALTALENVVLGEVIPSEPDSDADQP